MQQSLRFTGAVISSEAVYLATGRMDALLVWAQQHFTSGVSEPNAMSPRHGQPYLTL